MGKRFGFGLYLNEDHYDVTFLPINEDIEQGESTVLPRQVAEEIIRQAAHRVILPICLCRVGCRCEDYPMEMGCIFMGEGAKNIDPSVGRPVSVGGGHRPHGLGHRAGLIPQIGKVDPDPIMLGVKDTRHFLTLCFCCTCCCIAMRNMPRWSPEVKDRMHKLDGPEHRGQRRVQRLRPLRGRLLRLGHQIRDGKRGHRRRSARAAASAPAPASARPSRSGRGGRPAHAGGGRPHIKGYCDID